MGSILSSVALGTLSTTSTILDCVVERNDDDFKAFLKSAQIACTVAQLAYWIPVPYILPTFAVSLLAMPSTARVFGPHNETWERVTRCASIISKIAFCVLVPLSLSAYHPIFAGIIFFSLVAIHVFTLRKTMME
jgi:hypothetical protein